MPGAAFWLPPGAGLAPQRGMLPAVKDPGVTRAEAAEAEEPWTAKAEKAEKAEEAEKGVEAEPEPGTAKVLEAEVVHETVKVLRAEAKSGTEKLTVSKPGGGPMMWDVASVACCVTATACAPQRRS